MGEQGKVNWPEYTAGGSLNTGTEKLQRRAGPSLLEVGVRGEGKGANSAPEKPPPPTRQTGLRFLSKEFLRFWMVNIRRWEGRGYRPAPENKPSCRHRTGSLRWGHEGKGMPHPGRVHPSLWGPEPLAAEGKGTLHPGRVRPRLWLSGSPAAEGKGTRGWVRHKMQAQSNLRFCGVPENWNRTQRRARSI